MWSLQTGFTVFVYNKTRTNACARHNEISAWDWYSVHRSVVEYYSVVKKYVIPLPNCCSGRIKHLRYCPCLTKYVYLQHGKKYTAVSVRRVWVRDLSFSWREHSQISTSKNFEIIYNVNNEQIYLISSQLVHFVDWRTERYMISDMHEKQWPTQWNFLGLNMLIYICSGFYHSHRHLYLGTAINFCSRIFLYKFAYPVMVMVSFPFSFLFLFNCTAKKVMPHES